MRKKESPKRSARLGGGGGCCRVESLISVDERGQMVLPKDLRQRAGIRAGDKLAAVTWDQGGGVCCVCLIKADRLTEMVQSVLGPLLAGLGTIQGRRE